LIAEYVSKMNRDLVVRDEKGGDLLGALRRCERNVSEKSRRLQVKSLQEETTTV